MKQKSISAVVKVHTVTGVSMHYTLLSTKRFVSSAIIPVRVDPLGSSERQQGRGRGRGRGRGMADTPGKEITVKPGLQSEGNIIIHCNKLVVLTIEWLPGLWTS